jgi:hypothetical protein
MKISTNLTEIKELFAHHLGINVSELEMTIEREDVSATSNEDGGWVVNTKTSYGHPDTLKGDDYIEVEFSDGVIDAGHAADWIICWDIAGTVKYIAKYRKVYI